VLLKEEAAAKAVAITRRRTPCVLILHGLGSWRNQLFLKALAYELVSSGQRNVASNDGKSGASVATLRFDFTGCGESQGEFRYTGYENELDDVNCVIADAEAKHNVEIIAVVGHSKGVLSVMNHAAAAAAAAADGRVVKPMKYVALSGRFNAVAFPKGRFTEDNMAQYEREGKFLWFSRGARACYVTASDVAEKANERLSPDQFAAISSFTSSSSSSPPLIQVLIMHGDADETIPCADAHDYHAAIEGSELIMIPGADHNFNGTKYTKMLSDAITNFIVSPDDTRSKY
jgi:alpha/beta superfamily hydrolase